MGSQEQKLLDGAEGARGRIKMGVNKDKLELG